MCVYLLCVQLSIMFKILFIKTICCEDTKILFYSIFDIFRNDDVINVFNLENVEKLLFGLHDFGNLEQGTLLYVV